MIRADEVTTHDVQEGTILLLAALGQLKARAFAVCATAGLSPAQADALRYLAVPCSQRELAGRLHCDASNVTGIVDRLEAGGWAERQIDPSDRRVRQVMLTETGVALRDQLVRELFDDSPLRTLEPSEQAALVTLLRKIVDPLAVDTARHFLGR